MHRLGQQELPVQRHSMSHYIQTLHRDLTGWVLLLLVGVALQQKPAVLCHQENRLQLHGKRDGMDSALQHIQHLQLVATHMVTDK